MSQVDNRNSSAGKRARTDDGRREDDWTCPKCGNVNFSFRMTCNMHNCTQSRPADHNLKSAPKLLQVPPAYAPSAGYIRPGTPSIYLGGPPYGSSVFGGPGPYSRQISGGSAYYDYGSRLSVNSPFGQLHLSGPPHYSGGSMLGSGGLYGLPPIIDGYGVGLPIGLGSMGPRSGRYSQERSQEKPEGRENDWKCPNCSNNNFSFRNVCNMRKCNTPRPGSQATKSEKSSDSKKKTPEGSWKCEKCNNINYPFRTKCNRQNCGADKPSEVDKTSDEDEQESASQGQRVDWLDLYVATHGDIPAVREITDNYKTSFDVRYSSGAERPDFDLELWERASVVKKNYVKGFGQRRKYSETCNSSSSASTQSSQACFHPPTHSAADCLQAVLSDPTLLAKFSYQLSRLTPEQLATGATETEAEAAVARAAAQAEAATQAEAEGTQDLS